MNSAILLLALFFWSCSGQGEKTAGGTSDQGNAIVLGKVVNEKGEAITQASINSA
jgi:hypothetical protein